MAAIFEQMKTVKDRVFTMLRLWPHLRDDDFKLIASYWKFEAEKRKINLDQITANEFLKQFSQGRFTHSESIRRVRAKLQEENERLRGSNYGQRQKDGQEVQESINKEL